VRRRGQAGARAGQGRRVQRRADHARARAAIRQHRPPRVHRQAVAVGGHAIRGIGAALVGRQHKSLVLDGARPHQHFPVRPTRGAGEIRRQEEQVRAGGGIGAEQFREA